jgi:Domain of unknown function (DUF4249)
MKKIFYCLMVLLVAGCKQRYDSPVHSPVTGYLVVDGVINSGIGATTLTLTRTTNFNNKNIVYEKGALVSLQGEDSSVYTLTEKIQGQYSIDSLKLNNNIKYRLRINTTGNKQYISDFTAVRYNPAIDSISWKVENNGVQLYINTHDPANNTHYYQWYYDEAWEFHSSFFSFLKYYIKPSPAKGDIYSVGYTDSSTYSYNHNIVTCWQFNNPAALFLGSTAKLTKDIVYLPVAFIPYGSIKLGVLYSMHMKQYSWTADGYAFLERMKKNTESTGSVFDAQPSELSGNIHCVTDATEPVIGYFSICPVWEKRIFIKNADIPGWFYNPGCVEVVIENKSDSIIKKGLGLLPTVIQDQDFFGGITTYRAAPPECVDCTLSGTNKKPAYWP